MDAPIPLMQNVARAAAAASRAQTSMDPVKLIASDGTEIIIDKRAAMVSGTIKSMLSGPGASRAITPPGCRTGAFFFRRQPGGNFCCFSIPIFLALLPGNACEAAAASRDTHTASLLARTGQFAEGQKGEIKFPEISGKILETVVRYFYYKLKHTNHQGPLPEFKIAPELALELLMAANFLDT